MSAQRFGIHVQQTVLDDLARRLERTRWTTFPRAEHAPGHWKTGTYPKYLHELCDYWRTTYDWRRQEEALNALPQWRAKIGTADLHFVHARTNALRSLPLLLLHGWPDSFFRFHKVIARLSNPDAQFGDGVGDGAAFDVVVPSLPGFGFTGPVALGPEQPARRSAELLWRLMTEVLGYRRFVVAGGDTGSVLAQILAIDHPDAVVAIHLTDIGWHATLGLDPSSLSRPERRYVEDSRKAFQADGAYAMLQTTRPGALATALSDSPIGLASWIVDRFHAWCDGHDVDDSFGREDLLTNVMIYWVTNTIGPSMASYFASARSPSLTPDDRVERPVAVALFPHDIGGIPPRALAERTLNVQRWTEMPRGGHFAALEEPDLYAHDLVQFFRPFVAGAGAGDRAAQQERSDVHRAV